jgi:hypothetical protein
LTVGTDVQTAPFTTSLLGTGVTPAARITPASLIFGAIEVGKRSPPQRVTLTNLGQDVLDIASIAPAGPHAAAFAGSGNCAQQLAPGASCVFDVTFAPTLGGAVDGTLEVQDSAVDSPHRVALSGTGLAPQARLVPASVDFGAVPVGGRATRHAVLQNIGTAPLPVTAVQVHGASGVWVWANCGAILPPGGSCGVALTFCPTAATVQSGSVTVGGGTGPGGAKVLVHGVGAPPPDPPSQAAPPPPPTPVPTPPLLHRGGTLEDGASTWSGPLLDVAGSSGRPALPAALGSRPTSLRVSAPVRVQRPLPAPPPTRPLAGFASFLMVALSAIWVALALARRPKVVGGLVVLDDAFV